MKFINLFVLITVSFFVQFSYAQVPTTGAYTTDEQEFFVSGNRVNESLERVNLLLCYLANTKPAEFVNKETYVATIFEDDCSFGKASKDDQQKASQARGGSSGGGNSNSGGGSAQNIKEGNTAFVKVTQVDGSSPMLGSVWIQLKGSSSGDGPAAVGFADPAGGTGGGGGNDLPFDATVYLKYGQTASSSETSKFGDFKMNYTMYADAKAVSDSFYGMAGAGAAINIAGTDSLIAVDDFGKTQKEKMELQNFSLGNGYLEANGQTITFRESIMGSQEITITFSADGATGIYSTQTWDESWMMSARNNTQMGEVKVFYAFEVSDSGEYYCEKAISAEQSSFASMIGGFYDFADPDSKGATEGISLQGATIDLGDTGISTAEICYDTDKANAFTNVFRYGIYNADGTRHGESAGSFPIRSDSESGDDLFGWADYWGVWVDYYAQEAGIDPTTRKWKRDDGQSGGNFKCSSTECDLTKNYLEITKFSTSYRSLDSIHKIKLDISEPWETLAKNAWATLTNSTAANGGVECDWTHYDDPANENCFYSYIGYWDKDGGTGNEGALTLTHGMKWSKNGDPEVQLSAPIVIDGSNYAGAMQIQPGYIEQLGAWSPDIWTYFQIPGEAFQNANHASVAAGIGIKNEQIDRISIADLETYLGTVDIDGNVATNDPADRLACINLCLKPDLYNLRLSDAVSRVSDNDPDNDDLYQVQYDSIWDTNHLFYDFDPGVGESFGELDGLAQSDITEYIIDTGKIYYQTVADANEMTVSDANTTAMATATATLKEPVTWKLWGMQVKRPDWTAANPYSLEYISWSARTGFLVPARKPAADIVPIHTFECPKDEVGGGYLLYDVDHPRYLADPGKMNEDRYCNEKIWSGQVSTYFEIGIMTEGVYQLSESGTKVAIQQPKTLELDATQWDESQKTAAGISAAKGNLEIAEKTYQLQLEGFGSLWNIPGGFFNTCTGLYEGDYINGSWSDCYRWVSKFTIPDGSQLTDNSSGSPVTLYAKRLNGDQFLATKVVAGTRDYAAIQTDNPIAEATKLTDMGPNGTETNKIGTVPTLLRNNGDPSVIMGKIKETTEQLATVPTAN